MRRVGTRLLQLMGVVILAAGIYVSASAQTPAAAPARHTVASAQGQVENEIKSIEEQERLATLRGDTGKLEQYWANDLVVNTPTNSITTGAEILQRMKAGRIKYRSFERKIDQISVRSEVAIAMGLETVVFEVGPQPGNTLYRRYTNVYAQRGGQWRLIARQATLISANPQPQPEPQP